MTKRRKSGNPTDNLIEQTWYRLASGVQVNIMDIPAIFRECAAAMQTGASCDDAVTAAIAKHRKN